jgi:hypothetical protein
MNDAELADFLNNLGGRNEFQSPTDTNTNTNINEYGSMANTNTNTNPVIDFSDFFNDKNEFDYTVNNVFFS